MVKLKPYFLNYFNVSLVQGHTLICKVKCALYNTDDSTCAKRHVHRERSRRHPSPTSGSLVNATV